MILAIVVVIAGLLIFFVVKECGSHGAGAIAGIIFLSLCLWVLLSLIISIVNIPDAEMIKLQTTTEFSPTVVLNGAEREKAMLILLSGGKAQYSLYHGEGRKPSGASYFWTWPIRLHGFGVDEWLVEPLEVEK